MGERLRRKLPRGKLSLNTGEDATTLPRNEVGPEHCGDKNDGHGRPEPDPASDRDEEPDLDRGHQDERKEENRRGSHTIEDTGMG